MIQKLLDEKKAKKEAIAQKKREEEEEQKTKQLAAEKKLANDAIVAAAKKKAMAAEAKAVAATTAAAQTPPAAAAAGGGGTLTGTLEDKDPDDYCCPVSLVLMQDPVVAADGITYDRSTIQGWFDNCVQNNKPATSPNTGAILPHTYLIPNNALKNLIDTYRKQPKGK